MKLVKLNVGCDVYDKPNGTVVSSVEEPRKEKVVGMFGSWIQIESGWIHNAQYEEVTPTGADSPFERMLTEYRSKGITVRIFIVNGYQQVGYIAEVDYVHDCLILQDHDGYNNIVMFSAISTIAVDKPRYSNSTYNNSK